MKGLLNCKSISTWQTFLNVSLNSIYKWKSLSFHWGQLRIKKHKHCCRINKNRRNEAASTLVAAFLVQQTHFLNCLKNVPCWLAYCKAYTPQLRALFCQAAKAAKAAPCQSHCTISTHTIWTPEKKKKKNLLAAWLCALAALVPLKAEASLASSEAPHA